MSPDNFVIAVLASFGISQQSSEINSALRISFGSTELARLGNDGNLGIGTSDPKGVLHIVKDRGLLLMDNSAADFWGLLFRDSQLTDVASFRAHGGTGELRMGAVGQSYFCTFYSGGSEVMRATVQGNIGVATAEPTSKLQVAGPIALSITSGGTVSLGDGNSTYLVNVADSIVTLPSATGIAGRIYTVKAISPADNATIACVGGETIHAAEATI